LDRDYSPREVIAIVRRRRWAVVSAVFVGLGLASAASMVLPKTYKTSTRIEVTQNRNMPGSEYAAKVDAVRDQICSMSAMEPVVDQLGLVPPDGGNGLSLADRRALAARGLISATRVEKDEPVEGTYIIRVEHAASSPDLAYRTLACLVGGFKEDLYARPREQQRQEVDTHRRNVEAAADRVQSAQDALAEYEKANSDLLRPIEEDLSAVQKEIHSLEEKDLVLWKEKLQQADEYLAAEQPFTRQQVRRVEQIRMANVESELNKARNALNEMTIKKRWTDDHPDVQTTRANIAELEKQKAELEKNAPVEETLIPNPIFAEYTKLKGEAKSQLLVSERRVAGLRLAEKDLQAKKLQAPPVRGQRARLEDELKGAKQVLDDRQKELARAEDKFETIDKERQLNFKVIDEPLPPRAPSGPGPAIFALGGLVLGAGAGLGLAWILDVNDRSFRDVDAAAAFLGLPSLGAIHALETPAGTAAAKAAATRRLAVVAVLGVLAVTLAASALLSAKRAAPPADAIGGR
jgi:uncharacterized protein involved in exopolysaccharide biosynthesis